MGVSEKRPSCRKKRAKPTRGVETSVLLRSKRRCCLCFHLNDDLAEKKGQIAHLDRDPSNNQEDNLAFLCLEHHAVHDPKQTQAKGFTQHEVKTARRILYEYLEERGLTTPSNSRPLLLVPHEVALVLRVDEPAVLEWLNRGELGGVELDGRWLTTPNDVIAFVAERKISTHTRTLREALQDQRRWAEVVVRDFPELADRLRGTVFVEGTFGADLSLGMKELEQEVATPGTSSARGSGGRPPRP